MPPTVEKKRSKAKRAAGAATPSAGVAAPAPAPAPGSVAAVMSVQRAAGNTLTSGLLEAAGPSAASPGGEPPAPSPVDLMIPERYRGLSLRELRKLAVGDKDAAEALWTRYNALPDDDLNRLANNDDALAVTVRDQRLKSNDPVIRAAIEYRPFSEPGVHEKLLADIRAARAESGIRRSSQSAVTPDVEEVAGGTMLAAVTNIPGAERPRTGPDDKNGGRGYIGRSPAAGGKVNPVSAFPPAAPYKLLPHTHGHAEQNFADQLSAVLQNVDRELLKGKKVWMLVEQAACSTCAAGLRDPNVAPGVLKKLSLTFPELTFEVKNIDENRTLIVQNGVVLNVVPTTKRGGDASAAGGPKGAGATGAKAATAEDAPAAPKTEAAPAAAKGEAAHAQTPTKATPAAEADAPPPPAKAPAAAPPAARPSAVARPHESAAEVLAPVGPKTPGATSPVTTTTAALPPAATPSPSPAAAPASPSAAARVPTIPGPPAEPGLAPTHAQGLNPQRLVAQKGAPVQPVVAGGPSPVGEAVAGGAQVGLQVLNEILNHFARQEQEERVAAALAEVEQRVSAFQALHPDMGVTLVVYYSQWEAPPDSPIRPGPRFERIEMGYGRTPEEAYDNWRHTPALRAGLGHGVSEWPSPLWVPPPAPAPATPEEQKPLPAPPFPRLSLATFAGAATLQTVSWDDTFGFDDEGETALAVPDGFTPLFYVLDLPERLKLVNMRARVYEDSIPVEERGVGGGSAPVLDLDPLMPGGTAAAVCVFPADRATAKLFETAPPTYGHGQIISYDNLELVRWVRPEHIRFMR